MPQTEHADPQLVADMALAQRVVSLGRAARESASLKMRQPLAEAIVGLPGPRSGGVAAPGRRRGEGRAERQVAADGDRGQRSGERDDPSAAEAAGQKYGQRFPAIRQALLALDPLAVAAAVEAGSRCTVTVDGEAVDVLPEEVEVRKSPKPGLAVAEEAGYLVAVTTELTDELRWEGWAREVSRNIQELRKKSGLEISDRIRTTVQAGPKLAPVWEHFGAVIAGDTLSVSFDQAEPASGAFTASLKLDGEDVVLGIRKA